MADQLDMESQLAILRSLRAAADTLAQAQSAAEERKRADLAAAQAVYDAEEADANAMLSQAEAAHEQGRRVCSSASIWGVCLRPQIVEHEAVAGDDPPGEPTTKDALEQTLIELQAHVGGIAQAENPARTETRGHCPWDCAVGCIVGLRRAAAAR